MGPEIVEWMREHGSSVSLSWGEGESGWEFSWITGDARFTEYGPTPAVAIRRVVRRVVKAMEESGRDRENPEFYEHLVDSLAGCLE